MYASSSCPGNAGGIDTLVASYSPALSLDSAVQEAYSCEGCRKLMDRMYEKAEVASIEHHSPAPLLRRGSYGVGSYTMDKRYGLSVNGAMAYAGNQGEIAFNPLPDLNGPPGSRGPGQASRAPRSGIVPNHLQQFLIPHGGCGAGIISPTHLPKFEQGKPQAGVWVVFLE